MGLLESLFNKDSNKIEELDAALKAKNAEIEKLKEELAITKEKAMSLKQVEVFEKNLKATREQNSILKSENEELSKKLQSLENKCSTDNQPFSLDVFKFKLSVEEFFTGAKFKEIREFLDKYKILFIQDFEIIKDHEDMKNLKNYPEALDKYLAFRDKEEVTFDNRVLLCKGERVTKVYKKSRKFLNYLADLNIEFMDAIEDFDFESLVVKGGFKKPMVKELEKIAGDYFEVYRIY